MTVIAIPCSQVAFTCLRIVTSTQHGRIIPDEAQRYGLSTVVPGERMLLSNSCMGVSIHVILYQDDGHVDVNGVQSHGIKTGLLLQAQLCQIASSAASTCLVNQRKDSLGSSLQSNPVKQMMLRLREEKQIVVVACADGTLQRQYEQYLSSLLESYAQGITVAPGRDSALPLQPCQVAAVGCMISAKTSDDQTSHISVYSDNASMTSFGAQVMDVQHRWLNRIEPLPPTHKDVPKGLEYTVDWQASKVARDPEESYDVATVQSSGLFYHTRMGTLEQSFGSTIQAHPTEGCSSGLQIMQGIANSSSSLNARLVGSCATAVAIPGANSRNASGYIHAAVMHCCANEIKNIHRNVLYIDKNTAVYDVSTKTRKSNYENQIQGGALFSPLLLRARQPEFMSKQHAGLSMGAWAVTGGTGALGSLASQWMLTELGFSVVLLGRAGRLPNQTHSSPYLLNSVDLVMMTS